MPTPNMLLVEPTDHGSSDIWGSMLNAALDLIDAHDHTTGKGVKVPSAGLKINADISWSFGGTQYAITDMKALDFTPSASAGMTSYSSALFSNSTDANNLYYRNSGGINVKITDGNTLNVSIAGAIGGDYASVSALLDFDDASDTYRLRQQVGTGVRQFAKVSSADLNLFEYKANPAAGVPANSVTLKSPAALAGSYSLTFMGALPGSTSIAQCSSAGVLTTSNTIVNDLTMTATKDVIVSGTGEYNHGNKTIAIPPMTQIVTAGTLAFAQTADAVTATVSAGGGTSYFPITGWGIRYGDRIQTVRAIGMAANEPTLSIIKDPGINAASTIATTSAQTIVANNQKTLTVTTPAVLDGTGPGENWWLKVVTGASTFVISHIEITYDRP